MTRPTALGTQIDGIATSEQVETEQPSPPPIGAVRLLTGVAVLSVLGWAVPALLMTDRGFSTRDGGLYILSARWWHDNPYATSGAQYFYGPVFAALGHSIPALRVFRLVMILAANGLFAWTFVRWLATHRGWAPLPRQTVAAGTVVLLAGGGMSYYWEPRSPGYNDLAVACTLTLAAIALAALRSSTLTGRVPAVLPVLGGVTTFVLLLTKWSSALAPLLVVVGVAIVVRGRGARARLLVGGVAGFAVAAVATQLLVVRLTEVLPVMAQLNRLTADSSHGPVELAGKYALGTFVLLGYSLLVGWPLLAAIVAGRFARTEPARRRWYVGAGAALVLTTALIIVGHGWRGGHTVGGMSSVLALLVSAGAAVLLRAGPRRTPQPEGRRRLSEGTVVGLLLLMLPLAQAAGTADLLFAVAGQCLTLWVAAIVLGATRPASRPHASLLIVGCLAGVLLLTSATAATSTLAGAPDDTPYARDTVPVAALGGVRVPPATARAYATLRAAIPTARDGRPTPIFALDEMAGLVYVLGGTAFGPEWTDDNSPGRSATALRLACAAGHADRTRPPVVLLDRPLDEAARAALAFCGVDFAGGYHQAATARIAGRTIRLYLPLTTG